MREDGPGSGPAPIIPLAEWSGPAINNVDFLVKPVTLDDLKAFGKRLDGQSLSTQFHDRPFSLTVTEKGFEYMPEQTGLRRKQGWRWIQRFLERFNEVRSLHPGDYHEARNASYVLTIISKYLAAHR